MFIVFSPSVYVPNCAKYNIRRYSCHKNEKNQLRPWIKYIQNTLMDYRKGKKEM
jgi:hypothetical protein